MCRYYIDSGVFLADNMDLADNTHFFNQISNLKNHMWVARRARGPEHVIFQVPDMVTKTSCYQQKMRVISQIHVISQKNDAIYILTQ